MLLLLFFVFSATNALNCTYQINKIIGRSTISTHANFTASLCCAECSNTSSCRAWTMSYSSNITNATLPTTLGTCYLKDNTESPGVHSNGTHVSGISSSPAPPPPPITPSCCLPPGQKWVSAWSKCAETDMIIARAKANPGTFKSVLLYGTGLTVNSTPGIFNVSCQKAIEAAGIKVEAILSHNKTYLHEMLKNDTMLQEYVEALGAVVEEYNIFGVSLDWENVLEPSSRANFRRFLSAVRTKLNSLHARLTMYTNGEAIYDEWTSYFDVTDRLLDGSCYESESRFHWEKACRPLHHPNSTDHEAPALLSGWHGGKPGHWGYTKEAAVEKMVAVKAHNLTEVAMFNLQDEAAFWLPLLEEFLAG
eukprot:m.224806 g.224806  ORF g.224806 m.224806 type:complete len:364 (-) comp26372_c0_seq2:25-1116(-)